MATLSARISASISATLTNDQTIFSASASPTFSKTISLADGTAINQANRLYAARLSLTTTPTDLDLAGSLTDPLGATVTFAKIVGIGILNNSTTAGENVLVGGDAAA